MFSSQRPEAYPVDIGRGEPERIARRESRDEGDGTREMRVGCEEAGEELKAESSVSRRFVGVREEEEDDDEVDERLFGADIVLEEAGQEDVSV